jgi:small conductance mechanosensitive channel
MSLHSSLPMAIIATAVVLCSGAAASAQESGAAPDSTVAASGADRIGIGLEELTRLRESIETMLTESRRLGGEDLELHRIAVLSQVSELEDVADEIVGLISDLEQGAADSIAVIAEPALRYPPELYLRALAYNSGQLSRERNRRKNASPAELAEIELEVTEWHRRIDEFLDSAIESTRRLDHMGRDAADLWEQIDLFLSRRAESLAGRLHIGTADLRRLEEQSRSGVGSVEDQELWHLQLQTLQRRVDVLISSLKITSDDMSVRGLNTADYDQLIIETTGRITEDILDPEVLAGIIEGAWEDIAQWFRRNGPTLIVRAGMLLLAILLTRFGFWVGWQVIRLILRPALLLQNLVSGLLRPTSTLVGLLIGLWTLGVNPATLLAGVGVLSVILGLALQDSLGNIAAGIFILLYRPYDVDEIVQAGGVVGRVKEMGLANTTIVTFDRRRLFVPNKKIWSEVIENRSAEPLRRTESTVRIRYDEDFDATIEYLREVMKKHELVLDDPPTEVFVSRLDDAWVEISVWPWTRAVHWWTMETNLSRVLRLALDEKGIEHAFPRYEIHMPGRQKPDDITSPSA